MSIALNNRVEELERRVIALETALNIVLRAETKMDIDLEALPVIQRIKNDLQGIKMRMGKQ